MRRGGNTLRKLHQIFGAANIVKNAAVKQLLIQLHHVKRSGAIPNSNHGFEDRAVRWTKKIATGSHQLHNIANHFRIDQDRSQQTHFRFNGVWWRRVQKTLGIPHVHARTSAVRPAI